MSTSGYWRVKLDGVTLSGGPGDEVEGETEAAVGYLTVPPAGLGMPELRTEDVTYLQRDGVRMFSDWYNSRQITLEGVSVCDTGCRRCPGVRQRVAEIMSVWNRRCSNDELVIYTNCHGTAEDGDRALVGPYGVPGRPRVAELTWDEAGCATMTLRWDAPDHRMYVLDEDGTPGSGTQCVTLTTGSTSQACRSLPLCFTTDSGTVSSHLANAGFEDGTDSWDAYSPVTFTGVAAGTADAPPPAPAEGDLFAQTTRPTEGSQLLILAQYNVPLDEGTATVQIDAQVAGTVGVPVTAWVTPYTADGNDSDAAVTATVSTTGPEWMTLSLPVLSVSAEHLGYHLEFLSYPLDGGVDSSAVPISATYIDYIRPTLTANVDADPSSGDAVWCFDGQRDDTSGPGEPVDAVVGGSLCVHPTITVHGQLTDPFIENMDTGAKIGYDGEIGALQTVTFNTDDGTASSGGSDVTYRITGDPRFSIGPDTTQLRLSSYGADDDGWVEVCWRPAVDWA